MADILTFPNPLAPWVVAMEAGITDHVWSLAEIFGAQTSVI